MHFVVVCSKLLYCMLRGDLCCIAHGHEWHCVLHFMIIQLTPFIYNDVPGCVGMKTFRKPREIHNFSMTFSSDASFCLEGNLHKKCIPARGGILLYRKHALDLRFITSYSMIHPESGEHIWLWPAFNGMPNDTRDHFMVFIYIRRPYTPRDPTLAEQSTCVYRCR